MNITNVKLELSVELSRIPDFLLTTSSLDYSIWLNMTVCNDIFLSLVSDKVLKPMTIKRKVKEFSSIIYDILDIISSDREIMIAFYYDELESLLNNKCIELELYESMANINNFGIEYSNYLKL